MNKAAMISPRKLISSALILLLSLTITCAQRHVDDPRITLIAPQQAQETGGSNIGSIGSFKAQCWLVKQPEADAGWGRKYRGGTRIHRIHSLAFGTIEENLQVWVIFSDATMGSRDREAVVADITLLDPNGLVIASAKDCSIWTKTKAFQSPPPQAPQNPRHSLEYPQAIVEPIYCLGECFFDLKDEFAGALPGIFEARVTVKDIHGDQRVDLVLPIEIKD